MSNPDLRFSRRTFLRSSAGISALASLGDLGFLAQLPSVSAAEAKLEPRMVRLHPEIEPLVRLLENTPRERVLEEVASKIKRGTTYREVLAALLLAGVRNIQPRPAAGPGCWPLLCAHRLETTREAEPEQLAHTPCPYALPEGGYLKPVMLTPWTKWRWARKKAMMIGATEISEAAIIRVHLPPYWV